MADSFRFSPRPNRAAEIRWRPWSAETFDDAIRADRPILLNLTAVWCGWCQRMDETTYSDGELIDLINAELVPIRVDADQFPHVQERYIASGWPTNAFLTPTGEVLWAGTYVEPEEFGKVAAGVLAAWRERREELQVEIDRRRRALEAARGRQVLAGLVRREAADDVVAALLDAFDPCNGGFGDAPKFPLTDAVELLFVQAARLADEQSRSLAEQTLDGMLAGELWDDIDGGFFRYALAPDWTEPRREKLLEVNAGLLRIYALGAHLLDRRDLRDVAERTVAWAEARLRLPDGLWGGSLAADEEYYALDAAARDAKAESLLDPVVYTDANAAWIRALAEAGGRLGRPEWVERAADALEVLLAAMAAPGGLLYHFRAPEGKPAVPGLLTDMVEVARACVALAQATGRASFLDAARGLVAAMEAKLWAEDGGFLDHLPQAESAGALRYRERPFERNAAAARLYLDLVLATGERSYRAVAERTLALLSPAAGRYGVGGAEFALAVDEFFDPPPRVVIVGPAANAAPLRMAALALATPNRRVWTMEDGGRVGSLSFPPATAPTAYVCVESTRSRPVTDPALLVGTLRVGR
jgi:uncharacterized protein YyaL (SSP411 family)